MDGEEIGDRVVENSDSNWETLDENLVPVVAALYRKWLETLLSKSANIKFVSKLKTTLDKESISLFK